MLEDALTYPNASGTYMEPKSVKRPAKKAYEKDVKEFKENRRLGDIEKMKPALVDDHLAELFQSR